MLREKAASNHEDTVVRLYSEKTFIPWPKRKKEKKKTRLGFLPSSASKNSQSIRKHCGYNGCVMGDRGFK